MTEPLDPHPATPAEAVARCQLVFAHAWMVRTFVKHSEVTEEFPELMGIVRSVFDTSRALESKVDDPPAYLNVLRKKIGKLRAASAQFALDVPAASDHTNFRQAVISMDGCVRELERILSLFLPPPPPAMPRNFPGVSAQSSIGSPPDDASSDNNSA